MLHLFKRNTRKRLFFFSICAKGEATVQMKKERTMAEKKLVQALEAVLADTYLLYLKTQSYHWNVVGPHFQSLHGYFESLYQELAEAIDQIAERLRMLGVAAPGSFQHFLKIASLREATGTETADAMVKTLAADQRSLEEMLQTALTAAEEGGDVVTQDFLTQRLAVHQKNYWMLSSLCVR
jgi:starvation-inducible DNA-binding protein